MNNQKDGTTVSRVTKENRVTFRLDQELFESLQQHAQMHPNKSMSMIIRDLLFLALKKDGFVSSTDDRRYRQKINK
jgi:hypothetical protein